MVRIRLDAKRVLRAALLASITLWASGALAESAPPLPYFASLRSDDVNLRVGPGKQYRKEWVYHRKGLPVEVIARSLDWRKVRDWEGTEGWIQEALIVDKRTVIVIEKVRLLHTDADSGSAVVARAEPKVVAQLLECRRQWCRVDVQGVRGWLRRSEIWGVYPDEDVR